MEDDECLRDQTFVWADRINRFFDENTGWKNFLIIQTSFGMDSITVTYMIIMFIWGTTVRASLALGLFKILRAVLQG